MHRVAATFSDAESFTDVTILADDGAARVRGIRDLYLRELQLQCRHALLSLETAFSVADPLHPDDDGLWWALQTALVEAGLASRLLDGRGGVRGDSAAKSYARKRGEYLRAVLDIGDDSPLMERHLRDHIEHFDERLDAIARDQRTRFILDKVVVAKRYHPVPRRNGKDVTGPMLRQFSPDSGFVIFQEESFDLYALRFELRCVDARTSRLLAEPPPPSARLTKVEMRWESRGRIIDGKFVTGDPYENEPIE